MPGPINFKLYLEVQIDISQFSFCKKLASNRCTYLPLGCHSRGRLCICFPYLEVMQHVLLSIILSLALHLGYIEVYFMQFSYFYIRRRFFWLLLLYIIFIGFSYDEIHYAFGCSLRFSRNHSRPPVSFLLAQYSILL